MAKRQQVIHINSAQKGALPSPDVLAKGEIAVNINSEEPFLSIHTDDDSIVKISADNVLETKFDEKYATKEEVKGNEFVTATALNSLNDRIDEVESKQEKVFIMSEDFFEEVYDTPDENGNNIRIKQEYIDDLLENRYTRFMMNDLSDSLSQSYITYEEDSITIVYVFDNGDSIGYEIVINTNTYLGRVINIFSSNPFRYEYAAGEIENFEKQDGVVNLRFIEQVTQDNVVLPEENKQLFKKNMGSFADWNAQEGEAGYIENRTHYETVIEYRPYMYDVDGMGESYQVDNIKCIGDIEIVAEDIDIDGTLYSLILNQNNNYSGTISGGDTSWNIHFDTNNLILHLRDSYGGGGGIISITQHEVKQLDEKFIPDTIARKSDIPAPIIINYNTIKDAANSEVNTISEQTWLTYIANDTYKNYDWIIQRDGIKYNCTVIPDYDNEHIQILYFTRNEIEGTSGPLGNAIMKYSGLRIQLSPYTQNTYLIYKISNGGSLETREFVFGENYNKNAYLIAAAQMSGIDTIDCKWVYTTKIENSITNVDAIFSVKDKSLTYVDGNGLINKVTFADNGSYNISKNNPDISDTVVKTTPQTLTDADKNQALANLGLSDVATVINDMPIVKGDAENSVVLKGGNNVASSSNSSAFGLETKASGDASHAEGLKTISGRISQLINPNTGSIRELTNEEISILVNEALRIGLITTQSEFNNDVAMKLIGFASHAEGIETKALGTSSHAEGHNTESSSNSSHAEGDSTHAWGESSHAEGYLTEANGNQSHSEGKQTKAQGNSSHAEGIETTASKEASHAEGKNTIAGGNSSHAEGIETQANGWGSHAEGGYNITTGSYSHIEGRGNYIGDNDNYSTDVVDTGTKAYCAHSEGQGTKATGNSAHAEGCNTEANGKYSHAEGWKTKAIGNQSHSEGAHSKANGQYSHAEGYNTIAEGQASHTSGYETEAKGKGEFAAGIWNKSGLDTQFSIGIGTSNTDRKNAFEVKKNGDIYIEGCVKATGGFYETSDETLKNFGEDVAIDLDKIAQLPKKYFSWKDDENNQLNIGTSAQAVKELYPELVSENVNGKLMVDYAKLSVIALKAVDVLNDKMKGMTSDIEIIKKKLGL